MTHALDRPVVLCLAKIDGDPNYKNMIKQDRYMRPRKNYQLRHSKNTIS